VFFLALSCLQGRGLGRALGELAALLAGEGGIQLTPGNIPDGQPAPAVPTRRHHGFSPAARKVAVWSEGGRCLVGAESVHPPLAGAARFTPPHGALETMYPGYQLGTGAELEDAMTRRLPLAVDVSHIFLQRCADVITDDTWRRLQDYDRVVEVHVSANKGRTDSHEPIDASTFGLGWARARLASGTPTVLESYFHRLGRDTRLRQIELVRA
jgi:hypothetical protein